MSDVVAVPSPPTFHELLAEDGWRILLAAGAVLVTMAAPFPRAAMAAGIAAAIIAGWPIVREAAQSIVALHMTMELSMSIAIAAALAIGETSTALLILLFVLIAEVLERLNIARGRRALLDLRGLLPRTAATERGGVIVDVDIDDLRPGERVIVKPGTRISVDGIVLRGESTVDEAAITGESMPAEKAAGSRVFAGTLNHAGSLVVEVEALGSATAFGKIVDIVESADAARAPMQRLSDRLAAWIVTVAIGAAIVTALATHDARAAISVVIVAGACGVAAGTPLAILGGIGQAARRQIVIRGGVFLEALSTIDTVIFDKTGTMTLGQPTVTELDPLGVDEEELLAIAATAEQHSDHPIAKAILRIAAERNVPTVPLRQSTMSAGRGITAETVDGQSIVVGTRAMLEGSSIVCPQTPSEMSYGSEVYVARNGICLGSLLIEDVPRESSRAAIDALRAMGIRSIILTGDTAAVGRSIAQRVGVDEVDAELLPAQKQSRVHDLQRQGRRVAMVGDGINDAPALVEANVGIAMGAGADVTRESADVVLLADDLMRVADVIAIARRCRSVVMQNFFGTIAVDLAGIALAAAGLLHPVSAAGVHVTSELLFILNAARMLPRSR
jgi:heavy metal translocating P-type ATPase